jgi:hypothetical protein
MQVFDWSLSPPSFPPALEKRILLSDASLLCDYTLLADGF